MYLNHFKLSLNPFGLSPKLDFLFHSEAFDESIAHLIFGLDNSEAIVMITGEIGTGKSMAIQSFLTHLNSTYKFALVTNTRISSIEFLKLVLEDLEIHFPINADKSDLLILFKEFLADTFRKGGRVIIVIDEAQNLDVDVLEEVRLMTNLGQGDAQPVQVILLGQPELCATVDRPELAQLRQRIRVHYKLARLSRDELEGYVYHRMSTAGGSGEVFSKKALDLIFSYSGGVPRLVNSLCGNALLSAFVAGRSTILAEDISIKEIPALSSTMGTISEGQDPKLAPVVSQESKTSSEIPESHSELPRNLMKRSQSQSRTSVFDIVVRVILAIILLGVPIGLWQLGYFEDLQDGILSSAKPSESDGTQNLTHPPNLPENTTTLAMGEPTKVTDASEEFVESQNVTAETQIDRPGDQNQAMSSNSNAEQANFDGEASGMIVAEEADSTTDLVNNLSHETYEAHIASFRSKAQADNFIQSRSGIVPVPFYRVIPGNGRDWYRIYLGPFSGHEEANAVAGQLKAQGKISYYKISRVIDDDSY